jgi:hypothetical protein
VSAGPNPAIDQGRLDQARKKVARLFEEVGRLTEQDIRPGEFYSEFLNRVMTGLEAAAGIVWACTAQGNLQLQHQINVGQVGLESTPGGKEGHDELLRQALRSGKPMLVPPHSGTGASENGGVAATNATEYMILMVPVLVDDQVTALIEIFQFGQRHPDAAAGYLRFLTDMARLASLFTRNHQRRQMSGQQQLWTQLEAFSRQIHGSLNPGMVAYQVANEGRRLIDCDRVSVAVRHGRNVTIEAISGADIVEKRSNLVRLMRKLCEAVLRWGEKLTYVGVKDDGLPPAVLKALDNYLAESNSKLLVVTPLKDEREEESKRTARSALLMECFEPAVAPEQLISRMEVLNKHVAPALYNATEYRRIPFRYVWMPLAYLQEGLGGKARVITAAVIAGIVFLSAILYFVPYPLKMSANGQVQPVLHRYVYPGTTGIIERFLVDPNQHVDAGQDLAVLYDEELRSKLDDLESKKSEAAKISRALAKPDKNPRDQSDTAIRRIEQDAIIEGKNKELIAIRERTNSIQGLNGFFTLKAPQFPVNENADGAKRQWQVLTSDFRENLGKGAVRPSDPIMRLGYTEGSWEIELKIPQKHIGQVLSAYDYLKTDELDVDLILRNDPTRTFKGKLHRDRIGGEAREHRDDNNEPEPVVFARIRVDGDDIPERDQLPHNLLVTGTEVHAMIRCGNHRMGYSLFYGVWEFLYEKVVFLF